MELLFCGDLGNILSRNDVFRYAKMIFMKLQMINDDNARYANPLNDKTNLG